MYSAQRGALLSFAAAPLRSCASRGSGVAFRVSAAIIQPPARLWHGGSNRLHWHFVDHMVIRCRMRGSNVTGSRLRLDRLLHESHAVIVFIERSRHKLVVRLDVRDYPIMDDDVSILIVSMPRIIIPVVSVVHPRTVYVAVNENDECSAEIDTRISWRRTNAKYPIAVRSLIQEHMIPHIVIHSVIGKVVISNRAYVVVRRSPRRRHVVLNDYPVLSFHLSSARSYAKTQAYEKHQVKRRIPKCPN